MLINKEDNDDTPVSSLSHDYSLDHFPDNYSNPTTVEGTPIENESCYVQTFYESCASVDG